MMQDVLNLIKDIPEENWITESYTDIKSKCCLHGHVARLRSDNPEDYSYVNCCEVQADIQEATMEYSSHFHDRFIISSVNVNDGMDRRYQQATPKARCIALLEDLIEAGY